MKRKRHKLPSIAGLVVALVAALVYLASPRADVSAHVASLIDPAKLSTLKADCAANGRLLKCVYWMEEGRAHGEQPEATASAAVKSTYGTSTRADLVKRSLLRNLDIAESLGCLTSSNMERLKRGESPYITRGPYSGEEAEVDHIIPVAVAPQWENEIANLELLPRRLNRQKGASMGSRQMALEQEFRAAGM